MGAQADDALGQGSAATDSASPLATFLAVLRARGVPIGVAQHLEAARLLSLLGPTCDVQALARGLGALLARDGKEARLVENLFLDEFAEAFRFPDYGQDLPALRQADLRKLVERAEQTRPADDERRRLRAALRWLVPLAILFVAALVALGLWIRAPAQRQKPTPKPDPLVVTPAAPMS
ncbi:MAG TPA: hypothetical protein PKI03_36510, partial [Pseudomonadota bacterium]|nr:hypothetical protein [Pseudomonadota bacterium]